MTKMADATTYTPHTCAEDRAGKEGRKGRDLFHALVYVKAYYEMEKKRGGAV